MQILKVLRSQFSDGPCSAVVVIVFGSRKRVSIAVEEAPQTMVGVYINLRTLLAVYNGLGQVLDLHGECLTATKAGATKSGYTSVWVAVTTSSCWACCRE